MIGITKQIRQVNLNSKKWLTLLRLFMSNKIPAAMFTPASLVVNEERLIENMYIDWITHGIHRAYMPDMAVVWEKTLSSFLECSSAELNDYVGFLFILDLTLPD